jgi:hypothetical protein
MVEIAGRLALPPGRSNVVLFGVEYKLLALILMLYGFQPILGQTPLAYSTIRAAANSALSGGKVE